MRAFRILFFLWITSLALAPSLRAGDCQSPLYGLEGSRMFKTGIDLMGKHYSGLFLLKAMPDSSIRILFLSELGLNLLDMEYRGDEFRVVSVKEFINRKSILKSLQQDFRTLLLDLSLPEKITPSERCKMEACQRIKYRHRGQRYLLECLPDGSRSWVKRRAGLFRRSEYHVQGEGLMEICIEHRGIRMRMHMKEIER